MGHSKFNRLKLTLPKHKLGEHLLAETRVEILADWLKSLPYGNMKVTLPALKRSLASFNRTDVTLTTRLNAMAMYDRSYQLVAEFYRPKSFLLDKRQSKISKAERRDFFLLSQEMAYGYKLLAIELSKTKGANDTLAHILNLTLYYLSIVLMHHFDVYAPAPNNIWQEIHNILGYALNFDMIELEIPQSQASGCLLTIEKTYLRIALLSLVNPYHLNQGQHWPIWRYLSHWVKKAELNDDLEDFSSDTTFIVDLSTDNRPVLKSDLNTNEGSDVLLLMTENLLREVDLQLDALTEKGTPPLPGFGSEINATNAKRLLISMRFHWNKYKKRISPRVDANYRVKLINGIPDIYSELLNSDPFSNKKHENSETGLSTLWQAINVSSSGICLNTGGDAKGSRIGQLIAISESSKTNRDEPDTWKLGVTRWIQRSRREGVTLGVELITGEVQPIMIKILGVEQRQELGFLVSGEEVEGQTTPTLIYAHGALPTNQVVVMIIGDAQLAIRPARKIIETLIFERVFYQTRELSEAYQVEEDEIEEANRREQQKQDGNEEIQINELPGFTQTSRPGD